MTRAVLEGAPDVDNWTLYRALSEPLEGLGGQSPVRLWSDSIDEISRAVFNVLGLH